MPTLNIKRRDQGSFYEKQEAAENYIMRSFIVFASPEILFE